MSTPNIARLTKPTLSTALAMRLAWLSLALLAGLLLIFLAPGEQRQ